MTTIFHLVRHGANDVLPHSIAGRLPGLNLNREGLAQAERVGTYLVNRKISRIICSPLERALQTAMPLARFAGKQVEIWPEFIEVEFGQWTGRTFSELDGIEDWKKWNAYRSGNRVPGGESMTEVQARVISGLERLRKESPGLSCAVFSHGDPIRAALTYYLGMPLDYILRLRIDPGSVTTLSLGDWAPQLLALNVDASISRSRDQE